MSNFNEFFRNKGAATMVDRFHSGADGWSKTHKITNISFEIAEEDPHPSSYYIENGSYAKLRTIQLGYNMPKQVTDKLRIDRIRLYASAQNLLTIKSGKFTGADPENPGFNYPIPLNLTFGLNVSF